MKRTLIMATAFAAFALPVQAQDNETASALFVDADGQETGSASMTDTGDGVLIEIEVEGLPAGQWVAFHVHETGSCDHETDHESAGDHFDPGDASHGYKADDGPHAGDMPNQYVGEDGVLRAQVFNAMVTLEPGEETSIRDRSLMIHAGQDDYLTQPAGDAGDRLACAVIE